MKTSLLKKLRGGGRSLESFRRVLRGCLLLASFVFPVAEVAADTPTYVVCRVEYYSGLKLFTERFVLMESEEDTLFKGEFTTGRTPRVMTREFASHVPSSISHYDDYFPGIVADNYEGSHYKQSNINSIFYVYALELPGNRSLNHYSCRQFIGAENADNFVAKLKRDGFDIGQLKGWYPDVKYLIRPSGPPKPPKPVAEKNSDDKPVTINKPALTIKSTDTPLAAWTPEQLARAREAAAAKARDVAMAAQNDAKTKAALKKFSEDMKKRGRAQ